MLPLRGSSLTNINMNRHASMTSAGVDGAIRQPAGLAIAPIQRSIGATRRRAEPGRLDANSSASGESAKAFACGMRHSSYARTGESIAPSQ
jgi:hypothetical protein